MKIKKGDTVHGFSYTVPGYWEIESLRPFRVVAHQNGKTWDIDVSRKEFIAAKSKDRR